jgi:DNA helicase II / ATP-dependent DNA helicase PcrA
VSSLVSAPPDDAEVADRRSDGAIASREVLGTASILDPTQRAAATSGKTIQLVLAGPGSGKTTTLTGRFVHLVREGVDCRRILALTFTKKAADDMKARIAQALNLSSAKDLTVATFHGFAFRHLRRNPQAAGLSENFQLWDTPQQRHVFSSRRMWWNEEIDILDIIAGAKERLLDAESFAAEIDNNDEVLVNAANFFRVYEQVLKSDGAIDFADMVPLVVRAMDNNATYSETITGAYDHLLVDEYQDVNPGQVKLTDRFVHAGVNLWVVGDDDQTLYAFRAADVRFILDFPQKYRSAQAHVLDRNYRSAARIVAAAKRLIANNRARRDKNYQPVIADVGEVVIRGYATPEIEARQVARAVARLLKQHSPQQIAVLYRVGSVGLALQPALQKLHIPYEVRGAGDLWQGVAAKLVVGSLHYLRDGESVEAMSHMGSSRRADIIRRKLDQAGKDERHSFAASCRLVRNAVITAVPGKASDRDRAEWRSIVETVVTVALSCTSLEELEERISEQSAALRRPPANAIVLSTIHSAKGLEWEAVLMVGMEDGVLPHFNNDDIEEERRVAYVGITRAKRILGLTYTNVRYGQPARPSPFLHELAGRERRFCVWTEPRAQGADERLPLLSDRERRRRNDDLSPQRASARSSSSHPVANGGDLRRDRLSKKKNDGLPARHGHSWNADEDDRLRTMVLAGEAIAAMARAHQRKRGAIRSRLVKLGLIAEDATP